jgi:polysaccharide biosynthesis/export protein
MRCFYYPLLVLSICHLLLTGCANSLPPAPLHPAEQMRLFPGDTIRVSVFGEDNVSGLYALDSQGYITLPLAGAVKIDGKTTDAAQRIVEHALQKGFMNNPHVNIILAQARDVYLLGEVQKPGNYSYATNLTVLQAIAKAGGYTYRAREHDMILTRTEPGQTTRKFIAQENTILLPGDSITVTERFF